jgi:hypothetical protein
LAGDWLLAAVFTYFCAMHIQATCRQGGEAKKLMGAGKNRYGRILFLIGVQEHGALKEKYTKEQKQDLMHIAVCTLLSTSGFYELEGVDEDGWPHYRQIKEVPPMDVKAQEDFIRDHVLLYFQNNQFID